MAKKEIDLKLSGMHCSSCEKIITMELEDLPGAQNISVDAKTGTANLEVDPSVEDVEILETLKRAGYPSEIIK